MARKPILVVMAAGMGSRYGGLKQIDPVGSQGEAILDYSLYDAHKAGFDTAVIIIKEAIRKDFMETVGERLKKCPMEIRYAYQELDDIPAGYTVPEGRTKPWGTCHAVLCAREAIGDAPFLLVTSASHLPRAMIFFRHAGLDPLPAPANQLAVTSPLNPWERAIPSPVWLMHSDRVGYEPLGRVWQWLKGSSGEPGQE